MICFYGGKGGVGKTTFSAAAAVEAARRGERVLVVSLDPAHSLGDALGVRLGGRRRRVKTGHGHGHGRGRGGERGELFAVELDADGALARWVGERRDALRAVATRGTYLEDDEVERFLSLSLPGVDELIGLVELERLALEDDYDSVIVDTAPTGHTLRLLAMPETLGRIATVFDHMQEKHRLLAAALGGRWRGDEADDVIDELAGAAERLGELLRGAAFRWIMLPEALSLAESEDGVAALRKAGLRVEEIAVNRVTPAPRGRCALCAARRRAEARVLAATRRAFSGIPVRLVPERVETARGAAARATGARAGRARATAGLPLPPIPSHVRLLLVGGKGGVGKTTVAAALALREAERRDVLLFSADPAHSLADVLGVAIGDRARRIPGAPPGLRVRELDADHSFRVHRERYQEAIDAFFDALRGGSAFDAVVDRQIARELIELSPPGLDELFATLAVVDALFPEKPGEDAADLVIVDTAPTGHALRLLALPAAARAWVKTLLEVLLRYRGVVPLGELAQDLVVVARGLRKLEELLADPARTQFVAVTRAAALPVAETERLLATLGRLGIAVPALVVNALTPGETRCARCRAAHRAEARHVARLASVRGKGGRAIFFAPAVAPPPTGVVALSRWAEGISA